MFLNESNELASKEVPVSYDEMVTGVSSLLNETYYGKHPELVKCEGYLQEMKEDLIAGRNPNKSKAKEKMEKTLANLFGFEKCIFSILANEDNNNAFTVPFFHQDNYSANNHIFDLVKKGNHIKYKNPKGKFLYIYIFNYGLRNCSKEVEMGIIMHEIGHNFFLVKEQIQNSKARFGMSVVWQILNIWRAYSYDPRLTKDVLYCLLDYGKYLKDIQKTTYVEYEKYLSDKYQQIVQKRYEKQQKTKGFKNVFTVAWNVFKSLFHIPFNIVKLIFLPFLLFINSSIGTSDLKKQVSDSEGYNAEKFSDNFAITYGYGKEVASAFSNEATFNGKAALLDKIPMVRVDRYFRSMYLYFTYYFSDEHPNDLKRCQMVITKLQYELKNNKEITAKQREDIEEQIKQVQQMLKDRPLFKKAIDAMFAGAAKKKDQAGSGYNYKETDIYNFDKDLVQDHIQNEDYFNIPNITTPEYSQLVESFLDENDNSFVENVVNNIVNDMI